MRKSVPKASWEESREDYAVRLKQVVEGINNHHDVDALCRSFSTRLQKIIANEVVGGAPSVLTP